MASSNSSSLLGSADNSRYDQMLGAVTGLQTDLQRALGVCQSLRSENDRLKANYDTVKAELLRTREKYTSQRTQLLEAVEAKMEGDRSIETVVHKWRAQLEARTRELEALKSSLAPQDVDMLRAQLQEELEGAHQRKIQALESEAEKQRQESFAFRRKFEQCKAEYEQYTIDHGREMESEKAQHANETRTLRAKLSELEVAASDGSRDAHALHLRRCLDEAKGTETQLRAELDSVRAEKEMRETEFHKMMLAHQGEMSKAHATVAALEADKQGAVRRAESAERDAESSRKVAEAAEKASTRATEELARLRERSAELERHAMEGRVEVKGELDRASAAWTLERNELKAQIEAAQRRVTLAERRSKDFMQSAQEREASASAAEERVRRECRAEVEASSAAVTSLEVEVERLNTVTRQAETARTEAVTRLQRELDSAKSEVARLGREKEALHQRMALSQAATEKIRSELTEARTALENEKQKHMQTESQKSEIMDRLHATEADAEALKAEQHRLENEIQSLESDIDHQRQLHTTALKAVRAAADREASAAAVKASEGLRTLRARARRAVRKEQKRANQYKAMAQAEHTRAQQAQRAVSLLQRRHPGTDLGGLGLESMTGNIRLGEALARARSRVAAVTSSSTNMRGGTGAGDVLGDVTYGSVLDATDALYRPTGDENRYKREPAVGETFKSDSERRSSPPPADNENATLGGGRTRKD